MSSDQMLTNMFKAAQESGEPREVEINGRKYTTRPVHRLLEPVPDTLNIHSLDGLVEYANTFVSGAIVHIVSPTCVSVVSDVFGPFEQRKTHITAKYEAPELRCGNYLPNDEFISGLLSKFHDTPDRAVVLAIAGHIVDGHVRTTDDNGVSQEVTLTAGIQRKGNATMPPFVTLKPFRTFTEVEQPESKFTIRLKSGDDKPQVALYEADGGAWKLEAMRRVHDWISERLPETVVLM